MKDASKYNFQGSWIGAGVSQDNRQAPIFKKIFKINNEVKSVQLYICGLGLFVTEINGKLPDDSVLNPIHTQYTKSVLYRVFDITEFIVDGDNTITVELGNGFFNETVDTWRWDTAVWRSSPKFIANIVVNYQDNSSEIISTDESWDVTLDGPIIENSIYYGETHDLRRKDYNWKKAMNVSAPTGILKPQEVPPIRRIAEFKPKEIIKKSEGTYIIVAPEMITGWAKLSLNLPKDSEMTVNYGEKLNNNGFIPKIGKGEGRDGNWFPLAYIQEDKFTGNGSYCDLEPKFSYKGFKYIQIENCPVELNDDNITLYRVANDVKHISEFNCSNELINRLHALMKRTLLNNFQGKPTDTPVWEKNGWLGDFNCGLTSMMFNFDMSDFAASFVDTMNDCFEEYGSVPVFVPVAAWGTENSPVWNTVFVFTVRALLDYCGQNEYARKIYPQLKKFAINYINILDERDGLWDHKGLADWLAPIGGEDFEADPNSSEGAEICANAFIYKMLCDMVYIAEKLGKTSDIPELECAAVKLCKLFNEKYYNNEKGIYETTFWQKRGLRREYRQTSNLLPLAFGMVSEEHKEIVLENLVNDIVKYDYHLDTGCTGTKFLLPVLFDNGFSDVAFKVLTQTTYPGWGFWIEKGATSAWESWETTTRSQNHYFLACYDETLFTHIAGIKHVQEGFSSFIIKPELECPLDFMELRLETPMGILEINWKTEGNAKIVDITIPRKSNVEIQLKYKNTEILKKCSYGKYQWILA